MKYKDYMLNKLNEKVADISQLVNCTHTIVNSQAKFTLNESVRLDLVEQDINGLTEEVNELRKIISITKN